MVLDIVAPNENFRGNSYGEWTVEWTRWLHSENPDIYDGGKMLYLRGSVDYKPVGIKGPRFINPSSLYDRRGHNGEEIFEGTAIFIPIISTSFFIGDIYEGKVIRNEQELRHYVNKDTDNAKKIWSVIRNNRNNKIVRIVNNLEEYRFETPLFKLRIPKKSLLVKRMEMPVRAGIYEAITAGYFIIIRNLPVSSYRITFGGEGMGTYRTSSVYDIKVSKRIQVQLRDLSSSALKSKHFK